MNNNDQTKENTHAIEFIAKTKWVPSLIGYTPAKQSRDYLLKLKEALDSLGSAYEIVQTHTAQDIQMGIASKQDELTIRISKDTMDRLAKEAQEHHMDRPEMVY